VCAQAKLGLENAKQLCLLIECLDLSAVIRIRAMFVHACEDDILGAELPERVQMRDVGVDRDFPDSQDTIVNQVREVPVLRLGVANEV
jgi:hypothetical protein